MQPAATATAHDDVAKARRLRAALGTLALLVAGTLVGIATPEIVARAIVSPRYLATRRHRYPCWRWSFATGYDYRPSCSGVEPGSTYVSHVNDAGFRGQPFRDDDAVRILSIGDSCTWGWRVPDDASYPAVLQRLLDDELHGPVRYQVLNAGVSGYTTLNGLLALRSRLWRFRPAIVVFGFGWNDRTTDGDQLTALRAFRRAPRVFELFDWLADHSALLAWHAGQQRFDQAPRVPPRRFRKNLEKIVRDARARGARVVALSFQGTEESLLAQEAPYRNALGDVVRRFDVPAVHYLGPRMDLVHPTREGYVEVASHVLNAMIAAEYLPR